MAAPWLRAGSAKGGSAPVRRYAASSPLIFVALGRGAAPSSRSPYGRGVPSVEPSVSQDALRRRAVGVRLKHDGALGVARHTPALVGDPGTGRQPRRLSLVQVAATSQAPGR